MINAENSVNNHRVTRTFYQDTATCLLIATDEREIWLGKG